MNKDKGIAMYIHIPFCKQKCLYCDFPSYAGKEKNMTEYVKALSKEINSVPKRQIKTIFIGGGTPTYLSLKEWKVLKKSIDKLNKSDDLEFTIEANPGTLNVEKLKFFKELGVNRLSIGLQAWQNSLLKSLGRIHNVDEFLDSYNMARNVGFTNINVDLMFGLPNQTIEDWDYTLKKIVELNPEHISCYSLIIEEGTVLYDMHKKKLVTLPSEEIERKMYKQTVDFLKNKGYTQYEISNFSKPNKECKHNLVYWDLDEYIGCGSAAHSYLDGNRYRHTENIEEYINMVNTNKDLSLEMHVNSTKDNMEEFMFMGLRKIKGVSKLDFREKFGTDIHNVYGDILKKYLDNNLLIEKNNRIYLSSKGIEISNSIMCDFIIM